MTQVSKKIINFLGKEKVKFEIIQHRTTYTAKDRAATNLKNKIKPTEIAKSVVVRIDKDYFLVLIPSDKKIDLAKFKKIINVNRKKSATGLGKQIRKEKDEKIKKEMKKGLKMIKAAKKVELSREAWMKKNLPGKIGAVPPFSGLIKIPIFVDGALLRQKVLYLGSGEYEFSIKMTPAQFQKLEKDLVKGSFNKK